MNLTKDAKSLLFALYHEYFDRRKHGFSKSDSKYFGDSTSIHGSFFPDIPLSDIEDSLRELDCNDFVNNHYASNSILDCELSDYAIATLEALPRETVLSVADFISKFIP